jgi:hypothetical protein
VPDSPVARIVVGPGTVEAIDLLGLRTVATVDVGQQAGGIDFWKTVPAATH